LIWLTVSNPNEIKSRLAKRAKNSSEHIARRFEIAQQELALESSERAFQHHVMNDVFETAVNNVIQIIQDELIR